MLKITDDLFRAQKGVSFFLRIHRHLPDRICGEVFASCEYREDGEPINSLNQVVEELKKNPEFLQKEKEVSETQLQGKSIRKV